MQSQNIGCLRQVLKRGRIPEQRTVVQALRAHVTLSRPLLVPLLSLLRHHSLNLACDTADFLKSVYASYTAPSEVTEALLIFSERQAREKSRLASLSWYNSKLYRNGLVDRSKMQQLERVRNELKSPGLRFY